ncbi:hypothetical protein [Curtobacterium sp. MCBD17_040]|uniref:competence protein CoiA family protein n=1 Tax=Curtobacterium sp. MCBD17_040 TaxID=2175674 RepID=UPI0011B59E71|nr:hypothetical protein [Curtobacterium sp. MCBD17_040]WIB65290.1 hypothetical protein DEI94_17955 [Curtobacterium sp. MCBD17_040]
MPLVATLGLERVEAWRLGDEAWADLRRRWRSEGLVMSCGQPGGPVELENGTRFFRHFSKCDAHEGGVESPEHLSTKALVAEVAAECGWTAQVEAPSADRSWIADVLLTKPGRKPVAVEVQWASQTPETFAARAKRYRADGVHCVWLVGPKNHGRGDWNIDGDAAALLMETPAEFGGPTSMAPMRGALHALLSGAIRGGVEVLVDAVDVTTAMSKCHNPQCEAWFSYWFIEAVEVRSRCAHTRQVDFAREYPLWVRDRVETVFQSDVRAAFARSGLPSATEYRMTHSKQTNTDYMAQRCPRCFWHLGDGFIAGKPRRWETYTVSVPATALPWQPELTNLHHVCHDVGNGFCKVEPQQRGGAFPARVDADGDPLPALPALRIRQRVVKPPLPQGRQTAHTRSVR